MKFFSAENIARILGQIKAFVLTEVGRATEARRNRGTVATVADLDDILTPVSGDYAYVREDEDHNGESSRYDYYIADGDSTAAWHYAIKISDQVRDFEADPIKTAEITNAAVTKEKLAVAIQDTIDNVTDLREMTSQEVSDALVTAGLTEGEGPTA
jgi:glycine cleavage system H lipoate-binding protein